MAKKAELRDTVAVGNSVENAVPAEADMKDTVPAEADIKDTVSAEADMKNTIPAKKTFKIICRNKISAVFGGVTFVDGVAYTQDGYAASWFKSKEGYKVICCGKDG